MTANALGLLGLARKAGKLEIGEEPVGAACRGGRARLVLLAADGARNTAGKAARLAQAAKVRCVPTSFTKEELGTALGRSSCAVLALTDEGFAKAFLEKFPQPADTQKKDGGGLFEPD